MSKPEVRVAPLGDRVPLQQMLELYQHDLSDIWDQDLDSHGEYGYALDRYWDTEGFHPFAATKWAWRSKEYVVQIRPSEGGMVLQQLLYADEVRSIAALDIDLVEVGDAELKLAMQLIDQISAESYDPT